MVKGAMAQRLRVALVGLMHPKFPGDGNAAYRRAASDFAGLAGELGFDLEVVEDGIYNEADAWTVRRRLENLRPDFLLVQNTQFASGRIIPVLAELGAPLGLWALPEPAKAGPLQHNSFCGINMNVSILGDYLGDVPCKWFYGETSSPMFRDRLAVTVRALGAIKSLRGTKIAVIGGMADGFYDLAYDDRAIRTRFGVQVDTRLEFSDLKERALAYAREEVQPIVDEIRRGACQVHPLAAANLELTARVSRAMLDFAREGGFSGIALSCWPKFRQELGMVACAAVGYLNGVGMPVACEADVYGLLSMQLLGHLAGRPALLMDLIDFDFADQSALFWHCGVGCTCLASCGEVRLGVHSNPEPTPDRGRVPMPTVADMVYAPGKATVARITDHGSRLFLLDGEFMGPNKPSPDGSRGWMGGLRLNQRPIDLKNLMNTVLVQRLQHHYAVVPGDVTDAMLEVSAWLDMQQVPEVEYKVYMQRKTC